MLGSGFIEFGFLLADDWTLTEFSKIETRVVELGVCCGRHSMEPLVQQVSRHFPRRAFSRKHPFADSRRTQLRTVSPRVVGRIGLLIIRLINGYNLFVVVFEEVGAGGAFCGEPRLPGGVESRLHIEYEVGDGLRDVLEYAVRVDDSVFGVALVAVFDYDDGAAVLYFVLVERVLVL